MDSSKNGQSVEFILTMITVITITIYHVRLLLPDSSEC